MVKVHVVKENEEKLYYNIQEEFRAETIKHVSKVVEIIIDASDLFDDFTPYIFNEQFIVFQPYEYELYFDKNTEPSRYEIFQKCLNKNYKIVCVKEKDSIVIDRIETTDFNDVKFIIYKRKKDKGENNEKIL